MKSVAQIVTDTATALLVKLLRQHFNTAQLSEVVVIHNGQGLKSENRESAGDFDVYGSGGLVGRHSEGMYAGPFVVIGRKGSAGKVTFAPKGGWVTDTAYFSTPLRPREIQCKFLFYCLKALDFRADIITTAIPGINRTAIYGYSIPFPPLEIQNKMVEFLDAIANGKSAEALPVLPHPLAEQQRMIGRIQKLAAQIHEARTLRDEADEQTETLVQNSVAPFIGSGWPTVPLEAAVNPERPITYGIVQAGEHVSDGVPYIRVSDMAKPQLTPVGMLRTSSEIAGRYRRSEVREGDIVFAIRATVGKMRFVPNELHGANLTQGTARIAPSEKALGPYLYWALQSRETTDSIQAATKGSTFKEITLGRLRTIRIPLPPLAEQRRIVARLDALQCEVDALKRLQTETAAELDAMLPAILDGAFKGEL